MIVIIIHIIIAVIVTLIITFVIITIIITIIIISIVIMATPLSYGLLQVPQLAPPGVSQQFMESVVQVKHNFSGI